MRFSSGPHVRVSSSAQQQRVPALLRLHRRYNVNRASIALHFRMRACAAENACQVASKAINRAQADDQCHGARNAYAISRNENRRRHAAAPRHRD